MKIVNVIEIVLMIALLVMLYYFHQQEKQWANKMDENLNQIKNNTKK